MDVAGVVPVTRGFRVQAGVKNMFDKNYFYTAGYPEAGRTWFVNLRWLL
jgi:iron complex outermembrane receptor protein